MEKMFLIFMLAKKIKFFSTIFILFLTADSMVGTYLMAMGSLPLLEFYGTMAINFLIIILVMRDVHKNFPR